MLISNTLAFNGMANVFAVTISASMAKPKDVSADLRALISVDGNSASTT
jgi:hypothetical protein